MPQNDIDYRYGDNDPADQKIFLLHDQLGSRGKWNPQNKDNSILH